MNNCRDLQDLANRHILKTEIHARASAFTTTSYVTIQPVSSKHLNISNIARKFHISHSSGFIILPRPLKYQIPRIPNPLMRGLKCRDKHCKKASIQYHLKNLYKYISLYTASPRLSKDTLEENSLLQMEDVHFWEGILKERRAGRVHLRAENSLLRVHQRWSAFSIHGVTPRVVSCVVGAYALCKCKRGGGYPLMATTFVFDFVPEDFLQSSVRVSVTQMP